MASYQVHDLNQFLDLSYKILLFQYSEGILSAPWIGVALNLAHNKQPITCFLTHQSLFLHPCSCWDISLWILKQKNFFNEFLAFYQVYDLNWFSSSSVKFYCFNIQRKFSWPLEKVGLWNFHTMHNQSRAF